ncbi:hypothetical protein RFI_20456 [Reticulomyxa filosa]|uniref:Uncharacterized protein n=1 Tax=Reticulomyxa filosa TaxID=46433 RepID=X6MSU9_RETFI|nr:hypothetical protein RFI_20456 [Reticulomyxa filosa]|eukprot:ETO16884.1 hypothetical protein RFI_20456 [Reticulomyxa filosa]
MCAHKHELLICGCYQQRLVILVYNQKQIQVYLEYPSDLIAIFVVVIYKQYDLKKNQSKEEHENECNYNHNCKPKNYKQKINLKSNAEIEKLKESDNEKSKEIQQLKQC